MGSAMRKLWLKWSYFFFGGFIEEANFQICVAPPPTKFSY